jgi:hypothetical protein
LPYSAPCPSLRDRQYGNLPTAQSATELIEWQKS